jgi:ferredoxin-NADP reductase
MKLQFLGVTEKQSDVQEFVFKAPDGFTWEGGQYMHYVLPHDNVDDRGIERWFTNSAAPSEREIRITTRINHEHSSSFKQALQQLNPGDEIEADGPEGNFTLQDLSRHYVFIVGGIGVTPVRSILIEADARSQQPNATVLYANRTDDITFQDELDTLASRNPNLKVNYMVGSNRITDATLQTVIDTVENPLFYISGPEPMVNAMMEQLQALGVDKDNIRGDDFPGYEGI